MTFIRFLTCFLFLYSYGIAEERFLLVEGISGNTILELGTDLDEPFSPCSTFKIPLSLMGYDAGVLIDAQTPTWDFQEGYDDFLESWKGPQTPHSWMCYSCVWYSRLISYQLGREKIENYLTAFNYGNGDLSAGLVLPGNIPAWFPSAPLKISLRGQVDFINKLMHNQLPITDHALAQTKAILLQKELQNNWKIVGKTGWSGRSNDATVLEYAWFVGWLEKDDRYFPFAYFIQEEHIQLDQRIPRVLQLLTEAGIS